MLNRDKLNFWVRIFAILLAAVFLISFVFLGIGSNTNINLFDLIGGQDQQQAAQQNGPQEQIRQAEQNLQEHPKDPGAIQSLAYLYIQNNRLEDAERVLKKGREVAPKDPTIALLLGQAYAQQAQSAPGGERAKLYGKAGDALAAAAESDPKNADAYYYAGQAYDQAGEPAEAIKYYNGYLDRKPNGEQAGAVKERISALLKGGTTTGGSGGSP